MKGNLKKILPLGFSILFFSAIFVFVILRNNNNSDSILQLSPKNYQYKEKFGDPKSYESTDISSNGQIRNVRVNEITGASEPKIVSKPKYPDVLVVSANDFSIKENFARVFVSQDDGISWQKKEVPLSSRFVSSSYSDPWVDFDSEGNLYFVAVQYDLKSDSKEAICLMKSPDNGNTWRSDFEFIDYNGKENIELDRPKIHTDKSPKGLNTIYVTWIEIKGLNSFIMFSKSTDSGNTFSPPEKAEKNNVNYSTVITNSQGELYLAYLKDENKISVKRSNDKGMTWNSFVNPLEIIPAGKKFENQYLIKNQKDRGVRINSEPSISVSNNDELFVTYCAAGIENDVADVYFTKLAGNSKEFTLPVRVNSDKSTCDQFLPSITLDKDNIVMITYMDSRNDAANLITESFVSISQDGGKSFTDRKISTTSFNPSETIINNYFGDYNSCTLGDRKFIGVWTDGRNNDFDIYAGVFDFNEIIESMNR